jgi:hypothetical protein
MVKIDLKSGFFQIHIHPDHQHYFNGIKYAWTRLPMGHPLAPAIMQRFSTAVARYLHEQLGISMVAYLDWLLFQDQPISVPDILYCLQELQITINESKSVLQPTSTLIYLGLRINAIQRTIRPTQPCAQHLIDLINAVPLASPMDLQRIEKLKTHLLSITLDAV